MGYDSSFEGSFLLDRPLTPEHKTYLSKFAETRRMKRNKHGAENLPDPVREAVGLPIGIDGAYFVGATGFAGQESDPSIVDYNSQPRGQPGLWCQWVPTEDGCGLEWNGAEKFYCYIEWLDYLISNFLSPWGYILNGKVSWTGERHGDFGVITVRGNRIEVGKGLLVTPEVAEVLNSDQNRVGTLEKALKEILDSKPEIKTAIKNGIELNDLMKMVDNIFRIAQKGLNK